MDASDHGLLPVLPKPPAGVAGWPWDEETPPQRYASRGDWPAVSIVVPSYNQGAFIEETLRSLLLQNYPHLQLLVIDGGSSDETTSILQRYSPWLSFWCSEADEGQSHAIEKGLARCSGRWFNWLNSDDLLLPGALATLVDAAAPETVCVSGRTQNLRGETVFSTYGANLPRHHAGQASFLGVNQPGALLDLNAVRTAGGIRRDLRYVMDLDLWLRIGLEQGFDRFESLESPVAVYRYHDASKTCSQDDVFALEQCALLTDLAIGRGVRFPSAVLRVREACAARPALYPASIPPVDTPAAETEWLQRLVVGDNLLFRALRQVHSEDGEALRSYQTVLDELRIMLRRHFSRPRSIVGIALVHAMETAGVTPLALALDAFAAAPGWRTARAVIANAARSFR